MLLKFPEVLDFQKFYFVKRGIACSWKQGCSSSGSQLLCSSWDEPQIHVCTDSYLSVVGGVGLGVRLRVKVRVSKGLLFSLEEKTWVGLGGG